MKFDHEFRAALNFPSKLLPNYAYIDNCKILKSLVSDSRDKVDGRVV
jgi:hypothetical protein